MRATIAILVLLAACEQQSEKGESYDGPRCADAWEEALECEAYATPAAVADFAVACAEMIEAQDGECHDLGGDEYTACIEAAKTAECLEHMSARETLTSCVDSRRGAALDGADPADLELASDAVTALCMFADPDFVSPELDCPMARAACGVE